MSGRPNKEGIARVRTLIEQETALLAEIKRLEQTISEAQKRLKTAEREYELARVERQKEMARMDVVHSGNCGFEGRMSAFLVELVSQVKESVPERVVYPVDTKA
ncbi:hypothetical protein [Burkholderia sp. Bp8990]|uniref:hypothetical protein n=1 Tax=Burkholderia sp. Bp8990 TaxID=2184552 RepID=UPI000F5B218C|nr:hypothetical protein [Burkholderia sp. Bp8990]RQS39755.1 hypothetical protein DIE01_16210 [Burkholderia sp. Bp8990]